nr:unnamed protein product [Callosobruchus chinensis]
MPHHLLFGRLLSADRLQPSRSDAETGHLRLPVWSVDQPPGGASAPRGFAGGGRETCRDTLLQKGR